MTSRSEGAKSEQWSVDLHNVDVLAMLSEEAQKAIENIINQRAN